MQWVWGQPGRASVSACGTLFSGCVLLMRIGVLGPIEAEVDGRPLPIGGSQQRRLLGLLVVHRGHAVSTERIAEALWNGDAPAPEFLQP